MIKIPPEIIEEIDTACQRSRKEFIHAAGLAGNSNRAQMFTNLAELIVNHYNNAVAAAQQNDLFATYVHVQRANDVEKRHLERDEYLYSNRVLNALEFLRDILLTDNSHDSSHRCRR